MNYDEESSSGVVEKVAIGGAIVGLSILAKKLWDRWHHRHQTRRIVALVGIDVDLVREVRKRGPRTILMHSICQGVKKVTSRMIDEFREWKTERAFVVLLTEDGEEQFLESRLRYIMANIEEMGSPVQKGKEKEAIEHYQEGKWGGVIAKVDQSRQKLSIISPQDAGTLVSAFGRLVPLSPETVSNPMTFEDFWEWIGKRFKALDGRQCQPKK